MGNKLEDVIFAVCIIALVGVLVVAFALFGVKVE